MTATAIATAHAIIDAVVRQAELDKGALSVAYAKGRRDATYSMLLSLIGIDAANAVFATRTADFRRAGL